MIRHGIKKWNLEKDKAKVLCNIENKEGYCSFSRKALAKLLPHLEKGISLQTAIKKEYPNRFDKKDQPLEFLPPVRSKLMTELRKPIVERTLTEPRRIVNEIMKRYGKPELIRIELGRDLRKTAKQRGEDTKRMRQLEKEREQIRKDIIRETTIQDPSRTDILKVQLAYECGWHCPYTGKAINFPICLATIPNSISNILFLINGVWMIRI